MDVAGLGDGGIRWIMRCDRCCCRMENDVAIGKGDLNAFDVEALLCLFEQFRSHARRSAMVGTPDTQRQVDAGGAQRYYRTAEWSLQSAPS